MMDNVFEKIASLQYLYRRICNLSDSWLFVTDGNIFDNIL